MPGKPQYLAAFCLCLLSLPVATHPAAQAKEPSEQGKSEVVDFNPSFDHNYFQSLFSGKTTEQRMAESAFLRNGFLIQIGDEYRLYKSKGAFVAKPRTDFLILIFVKPYKCNRAGEKVLVSGYKLDHPHILVKSISVYLKK